MLLSSGNGKGCRGEAGLILRDVQVQAWPNLIVVTLQGASSPAGGREFQIPEKTSRRSARVHPTPFDLHPAGRNSGLERCWHEVQATSRPDRRQFRGRV